MKLWSSCSQKNPQITCGNTSVINSLPQHAPLYKTRMAYPWQQQNNGYLAFMPIKAERKKKKLHLLILSRVQQIPPWSSESFTMKYSFVPQVKSNSFLIQRRRKKLREETKGVRSVSLNSCFRVLGLLQTRQRPWPAVTQFLLTIKRGKKQTKKTPQLSKVSHISSPSVCSLQD